MLCIVYEKVYCVIHNGQGNASLYMEALADFYNVLGDVGLCPIRDNYKRKQRISTRRIFSIDQDKEESGRHIFGPYPRVDKDGSSLPSTTLTLFTIVTLSLKLNTTQDHFLGYGTSSKPSGLQHSPWMP